MRLRILPGRAGSRLTLARWRRRNRRFAAVQSGIEALWCQGAALRLALPEPAAGAAGDDDDDPDAGAAARRRATLAQWRSFAGLFLHENLREGTVPKPLCGLGAEEPEEDVAAAYEGCLEGLAHVAAGLSEEDVRPGPLPLDAAAEASGATIERLLAVKVRGIPRLA